MANIRITDLSLNLFNSGTTNPAVSIINTASSGGSCLLYSFSSGSTNTINLNGSTGAIYASGSLLIGTGSQPANVGDITASGTINYGALGSGCITGNTTNGTIIGAYNANSIENINIDNITFNTNSSALGICSNVSGGYQEIDFVCYNTAAITNGGFNFYNSNSATTLLLGISPNNGNTGVKLLLNTFNISNVEFTLNGYPASIYVYITGGGLLLCLNTNSTGSYYNSGLYLASSTTTNSILINVLNNLGTVNGNNNSNTPSLSFYGSYILVESSNSTTSPDIFNIIYLGGSLSLDPP